MAENEAIEARQETTEAPAPAPSQEHEAEKPKKKRVYIPTDLLNTNDAAKYLGCSTHLVRKAVKAGKLTCKRFNNGANSRFYFDKADLDNYLKGQKTVSVEFPLHEMSLYYNFYEPDPKENAISFIRGDITYFAVELHKISCANAGKWQDNANREAYCQKLKYLQNAVNEFPYQEAGLRLKPNQEPILVKDLVSYFEKNLACLDDGTPCQEEAPSQEPQNAEKPAEPGAEPAAQEHEEPAEPAAQEHEEPAEQV